LSLFQLLWTLFLKHTIFSNHDIKLNFLTFNVPNSLFHHHIFLLFIGVCEGNQVFKYNGQSEAKNVVSERANSNTLTEVYHETNTDVWRATKWMQIKLVLILNKSAFYFSEYVLQCSYFFIMLIA
jgi:hypothetical protein